MRTPVFFRRLGEGAGETDGVGEAMGIADGVASGDAAGEGAAGGTEGPTEIEGEAEASGAGVASWPRAAEARKIAAKAPREFKCKFKFRRGLAAVVRRSSAS